jgi:hypothetical protein
MFATNGNILFVTKSVLAKYDLEARELAVSCGISPALRPFEGCLIALKMRPISLNLLPVRELSTCRPAI